MYLRNIMNNQRYEKLLELYFECEFIFESNI